WKQTIAELPEDHFNQIQKETMETINSRFTLSRVFTYVGMAAIIVGTMFKIMHLAGADQLVIASFAAFAISLVTSSVSGIYINREKDGAMRVIAVVAGVVLLEIGYVFKIIHLPGADQLITLSIVTLLVALTVNTLYVHNNASGRGNLFTFLHEKYSPGIERFMLIILPFIFFAPTTGIVCVIVIFTAALQFTALAWTTMEKDLSKNNVVTLLLVIAAFTCAMVPMLGHMVYFNVRLILVTLFSFAGAFLCFRLEPSRNISSYLICIVPIMFFMIALMKLGWMTSFADNIPLHVFVMGSIAVSIFFSAKSSISRTFMILSLAGYYLEIITFKY
ncbi:MAG TPA: hypothetical protein VF473_04750, partial [Cyclobacteriaceae bacterium]